MAIAHRRRNKWKEQPLRGREAYTIALMAPLRSLKDDTNDLRERKYYAYAYVVDPEHDTAALHLRHAHLNKVLL